MRCPSLRTSVVAQIVLMIARSRRAGQFATDLVVSNDFEAGRRAGCRTVLFSPARVGHSDPAPAYLASTWREVILGVAGPP